MRWLPSAFDLVRRARRVKDLHLCVTLAQPPASRRGAAPSEIGLVRDAFKQVIEGAEFAVSDGNRWHIVAQREPCAPSTAPQPMHDLTDSSRDPSPTPWPGG